MIDYTKEISKDVLMLLEEFALLLKTCTVSDLISEHST